jgi:hypothetical protein
VSGTRLPDEELETRLRASGPHLTTGSPPAPAWDEMDLPPRRPARSVVVTAIVLFVVVLAATLGMRERGRDRRPGDSGEVPAPVEVMDLERPVAFEVTATALPDAGLGSREEASGVWTGREYLVWGGWRGGDPAADGAAYDPASDTWRPIPAAPIRGRQGHVAVWTGAEMMVWGGSPLPPGRGAPPESAQGPLTDGAAYDPVAGTWRPIAPAPVAAEAAGPARALWVGGRLIIALRHDDGSRAALVVYDPQGGTWRVIDAGFVDIAAVGDVVVGLRHDRSRPDDVTLAAVHPDTGRVDELDRFPVGGATGQSGIVAVPGGVAVISATGAASYLGTYDLAGRRWTAVHHIAMAPALESYAMTPSHLGQLHGMNGQVAVHSAGSLFVFDPASGSARAAGTNRVHCVHPNAATVWTGREWYQFGGLGACSGNAVGVRAHAVRLTMGPPLPQPSRSGSTIAWAGASLLGAAAIALHLNRRRHHRD